MALLEGTIAIILYIILILIIFKLVRSIVKTVLLAMLLFCAVVGVTGFLVISDFNDVRHNFGNSTKTLYLVDGEKILAGYSFLDLNSDNIEFLELEKLEELEEYYANKEYKKMLRDDYKIFLIDLKVFNDSLEKGIDMDLGEMSVQMDGNQINQSLYSSNPMEFFYDDMFESILEIQEKSGNLPPGFLDDKNNMDKLRDQFFSKINDSIITPGQGRATIFSLLFKDKMSSPEGLKDMYSSYKEGSILIYKETALFKFIKYLPLSLVERFAFKKEVIEDEN